MKKPIIILVILSLFLPGCEKPDLKENVPACIKDVIRGTRNEAGFSKPVEVWKWEVDGNTYYYAVSDCCDQYNLLYNNKCNVVCAPDGGFTGGGDGKCPDFTGEIIKTLVWKNDSD